MFKMKLRGRFLAPTLAVIAAGMLVATVLSYRSSSSAIEAAMTAQVEQISASVSSQIEAWVEDLQVDMDALNLAFGPSFITALADHDEEAAQLANKGLRDFARKYGYYEFLAVADADGKTVAASDPGLVGQLNVGSRSYFKASMSGRSVISDIRWILPVFQPESSTRSR